MKIKKKFLRILLVLLIVLTLSVVLINGKKISHAFSSLINKQAGTTLREDDLSNVVNVMYITLLDDQANVVATTNPNTTVHSDYVFTANANPRKFLSFDKKYTLLYEVKDTNALGSNKTLLEENVVYNMNLPEHMNGYSVYDGSITDECYSFVSNNDLSACGGIYNNNVMKIMFSNIENRYDITFNYQYFVKFDKSMMQVSPAMQTFDFGKFGSLQLMFEGKPTPTAEPGDNYSIQTSYKGVTSSTNNYMTWEIDLKNLKNEKDYDGSLTISLGAYISLVLDRDNPYEYLDIYVDGNQLSKKYKSDSTFDGCFYNDTNNCLISFDMKAKRQIDIIDGYNAAVVSNFGLILETDDLTGTEDIKVVLTTRNHSTYTAAAKTINYNLTAEYFDDDNPYDLYESRASTSLTYNSITATYNTTADQTGIDHGEIVDSIKNTFTINSNSNRNYVTIDGSIKNSNKYIKYYMNSKGFLDSSSNISDTFTIRIDDEEVEFKRMDGLSGLYLSGEEIDKVDPGLQFQLSIMDNYNESILFGTQRVLRGSKNADGDYYYLVISKSTVEKANYNSDGNNIYDTNGTGDGKLGDPAPWRIYLFNIGGAKVEVEWDAYLEKIEFDQTFNTGGSFDFRIMVNDSSTSTYTRSFSDELYNPAVIRVDTLNDGYYKWDVVLDAKSIKLADNTVPEIAMNLYLPPNAGISTYETYNATKNTIESAMVDDLMDDVYLDTSYVYVCNSETDYQIHKCNNYQSLGYSSFAAGKLSSSFSYDVGNTYHYIANNVPVRDDGFIHFVFFTYINYDVYGQTDAAIYPVGVEFLINDYINDYNGATTMGGNSPMSRYDLLIKSATTYPAISGEYQAYDYEVNTMMTDVRSVVEFPETSRFSSMCGNTIGHSHNCWNPIYFNGRYQFYISALENANIMDLRNISVDIIDGVGNAEHLEFANLPVSFEENIAEICTEDQYNYCLTVTRYISGDTLFGYLVDIYNLDFVSALDISYSFVSDFNGLTDSVNINNNFLDMHAYYVPFRNYEINESIKRTVDILYTYMVRGDLGITDNVQINEEYRKKIVSSVISRNSPTDYIEIGPIVTGTYNVNLSTKIGTGFSKSKLMPYLNVENLKITTPGGFAIYQNGQFASGYEESTISFDKTGNRLFTVHIVNSNSDSTEVEYEASYDLVINPEVRNTDFYDGGMISVDINTRASRTFDCPTCDAIGGDASEYPSTYDPTTGVMTTYASIYDSSVSLYFLYGPKVDKELLAETNTVRDYRVTYTVRGAGALGPIGVDFDDFATIKTSSTSINNSDAFNEFKHYFYKYSKYTNIKVHYENQVFDVPETSGNFNIGDIPAMITYYEGVLGFRLSFDSHSYNETIVITYSIETDYDALNAEAVSKGILRSNGTLANSSTVLNYRVTNSVENENLDLSDDSSGSYMSVSDVLVDINKSNSDNGLGSKKWKINFNTGLTSTPVTINDELMIISYNNDDSGPYKNATTISDIVIKVNNVVIYENGEFKSGWEDTVTITRDGLKTTYVFADTNTKEYLAGNSNVEITYVSTLDFDKLDEFINNVHLYLLNNVELVKGNISDNASSSSNITRSYKHTTTKTYLGNSTNDLTETNWKIEVKADAKSEQNVKLTDTLTLGSEFGNYLSISKFKIIYKENSSANETVIYDSENGINNLGNLVLSMNDQAFEVGNNGKYDFSLLIPKLQGNSVITILYSLKVDKENYIIDGEMLDKELVMTNSLRDEFTNLTYRVTGSSKVSSDLTKKFVSLGKDSDGFTRIKWIIDTNLAEYYDLDSLNNMEVTITDNISNVFGLEPNTVEVRYLTIKPNGTVLGSTLAADKYELSTEDNIVKVKLLDPTNTPGVRISFVTKVEGSITNVTNSVSLQVGNKKKEVKVTNDVPIFVPSVFGVIYSRDMLTYSIYAQKYLDGKVTKETFKFKVTEVNSSGTEVENGYQTTSTNGEGGRIEFNGIAYDEAGTYYYKVQEVIDDNKYEYDKSEYTVKVNVVEKDGKLVVDSAEVLDRDEIVFNNKTIKQTSNEEEITPLPENPNTSTFIKLFVLVVFVISITIGFLTIKKYRFLK